VSGATETQRYLLIRPGAIGDAIVTLPVVQRLKARFPGAYVELVVSGQATDLLHGRCEATEVSNYDDVRWAALFSRELSPAMRAFFQGFTAIILYLAEQRTNSARRPASGLGTKVITWRSLPPPTVPTPISLHLQGALVPLGITPRAVPPLLALTAADRAFAKDFWRTHRLPEDRWRPVVAVHPGSGSARKNWPAVNYIELAKRLRRSHNARILVVAGPADEVAVAALLANWAGDPPVIARELTLAQVGSVLARCACLVGNDSGIAHMAAALGVPTVAIFGPTDPRIWAPQGPDVSVAAPRTPCTPCTSEARRLCPDTSCLQNISVEQVYAYACRYLEKSGPQGIPR